MEKPKRKQKIIHVNDKTIVFKQKGKVLAAYIPDLKLDDDFMNNLESVPFSRVKYISPYQKINTTPRYTWAYGKVKNQDDIVKYKGLNFVAEIMPDWLNNLCLQMRNISKTKFGFDPEYNSAIIGRYNNGNDQIGFHFDTETFLEHHFCANVTIGSARDFQFRTYNAKNEKCTHEIKLDDKSVFFFLGLEHALPKRVGVKEGQIRYSISFRNMKNNIGIGNSYYYCRGIEGAINDEDKEKYLIKMQKISK
tara:strand:- start:1883 stop:2632 length:750 start_codon:yes stop_codon:yes gene_type:complete